MSLKCLIVDDEPVAQNILERYIEQLDFLELVAKCKNALEATSCLQKHAVDLIFLDIEMPHLNGIDFLNTLKNPPAVILTTAYREHALEGFELNVVDYLLKPISLERFVKAVNKLPMPSSEMPATQSSNFDANYIYVKADKKMVQVFLREILYIESLGNYVRIFVASGKPIISYQKLSYLIAALPEGQFFRCHRSYIVALRHIKAYNATHLHIADEEIPIGGSYRDKALNELKWFET